MAKGAESQYEMAHARQSDGLNVIFDQKSPATTHSRSRSRSRSSCGSSSSSLSSRSGSDRGRRSQRRCHRSPSSSSSSSTSSPHSRSRSRPRCHRRSSRCCCDSHRRYGSGHHRHSPPRRYRARSHSFSRSPSPDRYSRRSHYRSPFRSSSRWSRYRRHESRLRCRLSRSPSRTYRSRSRSRSSGRSSSLSLHGKRELLQAAKANSMKILGVENLELPEIVKPVLSELSTEPDIRVREGPEKTESQSSDVESDISSPKMSPKRKIISFSINNSVAKPTVLAPSCAKVTPRVDSYESRKPYGHWVPVKSGRTSKARKHTLTTSH